MIPIPMAFGTGLPVREPDDFRSRVSTHLTQTHESAAGAVPGILQSWHGESPPQLSAHPKEGG